MLTRVHCTGVHYTPLVQTARPPSVLNFKKSTNRPTTIAWPSEFSQKKIRKHVNAIILYSTTFDRTFVAFATVEDPLYNTSPDGSPVSTLVICKRTPFHYGTDTW